MSGKIIANTVTTARRTDRLGSRYRWLLPWEDTRDTTEVMKLVTQKLKSAVMLAGEELGPTPKI